ncbi:helix-turn-helix domain-containing protein [Microbacterium sp. VKM Ac-2870]|uniref:IclR family transcriptional regulator n=1 Tax=Microbacterium sp. VKM Ac-2870 TaxID=2783825 RepID=UPI00188A1AE3|nr:helix-turn-helix domain-containing protein [Microbacterium sp. VKM Ac-2870]MBF4562802.1 helix-turn-helix domain-containing protein [Microbacterium sp. VKM Ac-2870]
MTTSETAGGASSQTLDRGIRILELLADERHPQSIDEIAASLGLHRSVAYRLIRTLEAHGLVEREATGRLQLGARLAALAAGVAHDLQAEALPELTEAANDLGVTCFLVVLDRDECVTLVSVEPRHAVATVAQRPGTRHPVDVGAPGKAILTQMRPDHWPAGIHPTVAANVRDAAVRGWAESQNEVISSLHAVAVPLSLRGRSPAAIAAVYLPNGQEAAAVAERLIRSANAVRAALGG